MSPNDGILLNGVLRSKLFNIPFASCFFINRYFLLLHIAHFHVTIVLPFLIFNSLESTFFVFCLHFKQYVNMFYNGLCLP